MSSASGDDHAAKFEFKGKYGAQPNGTHTPAEASHEEIDAFVREILGVLNKKENPSNES